MTQDEFLVLYTIYDNATRARPYSVADIRSRYNYPDLDALIISLDMQGLIRQHREAPGCLEPTDLGCARVRERLLS